MAFVYENWLLILVAFVSGAMLVWPLVQRGLSPMKDIGTSDLTRLINSRDALPLDVREPKEFDGTRLPNALHIPLSQLAGRTDELKPHAGRPIVAYDTNGSRARMAGGPLTKAGFTEVYHLTGGFRAWKAAGLPVEKVT